MAAHFEVFNKLRDFGKSLDKISNTLPTDSDKEEINKARACLQLRALLTEAKNLKEETNKLIADAKGRQTLDGVLAVCEKQTCKIRDNIENLEDHLSKYGYNRPSEKLPQVSLEDSDIENSDQCSNQSPQSSSSDKENRSPRSEDEEMSELTEEHHCTKFDKTKTELTKLSQVEEIDYLATPVRPTTFTKFIQDLSFEKENHASPDPYIKTPPPPVTTTPLLKIQRNMDNNLAFNTPESLELPAQPATKTPMIKAGGKFDSSPTDDLDDSLLEDFPTPPTFATPGLNRYHGTNGVETSTFWDDLKTPSPPSFAYVKMLNPDDISTSGQATTRTFQFPNIDDETYKQLHRSLHGQFSLELMNQLISKTNSYLNARGKEHDMTILEEELVSVLQLGPFTKPFALAMLSLDYFEMKKPGVYCIHSKMMP